MTIALVGWLVGGAKINRGMETDQLSNQPHSPLKKLLASREVSSRILVKGGACDGKDFRKKKNYISIVALFKLNYTFGIFWQNTNCGAN